MTSPECTVEQIQTFGEYFGPSQAFLLGRRRGRQVVLRDCHLADNYYYCRRRLTHV